ncbi:MAG: YkvA family protein [Opitutaceae bacterium]
MTTQLTPLPEALARHLHHAQNAGLSGLSRFIEEGAAFVSPEALTMLREQRLPLHLRIAALGDSERLRGRLELLAAVFDEAAAGTAIDAHALREIAFALIYFMHNADRIPDSLPQIGLLDDAVVVQFILQRQAVVVGAIARRRGWVTPAHAA